MRTGAFFVNRTPVPMVVGICCLVWPMAAQVRTPAAAVSADLEAIWTSATVTPLERPARLQGKAFFTPDEAHAWERGAAEQNTDKAPAASTGVGTYNGSYRELGTRGGK